MHILLESLKFNMESFLTRKQASESGFQTPIALGEQPKAWASLGLPKLRLRQRASIYLGDFISAVPTRNVGALVPSCSISLPKKPHVL